MKFALSIPALLLGAAACLDPAAAPAPPEATDPPALAPPTYRPPDVPPDLGPPPLDRPDLRKVLPWRAVNLIGPGHLCWQEYDYRPRAEGGFKEDIDRTLDRLKALGVRQVLVHTLHAWSVEPAANQGMVSTVAYRPSYRPDDPRTWEGVPRNRRADMGLVPWYAPPSWSGGPLELVARAKRSIADMLDAVRAHGMIPVLISEVHLGLVDSTDQGSADYIFTDPSRDFDQFYRMFQEYLVDMTRLGARHGAAMFFLGSETPYLAGAGQGTFADGSRMAERQPLIAAKWRDIIAAVRAAARAEGRPDMVFSYAEINPFYDGRPGTTGAAPIWSRIPFWDDLDAVGINFYQPGRWTDGRGRFDTAPKTVEDMVRYGEAYSVGKHTSIVPSLEDLRAYFVDQKRYSLSNRPVVFAGDGCTATRLGAANPANPPFLRAGEAPDITEQRNLIEAHFRLAERHGQGWLGGIGLWQVPPTGRWGGPFDPRDPGNYSEGAAYYNFLGTESEQVVRTYFERWR